MSADSFLWTDSENISQARKSFIFSVVPVQHVSAIGLRLDPAETLPATSRPSLALRQTSQTRATARTPLLGLLIYIEHPSLIIGFLERSCCDFQLENFPDYFTRNKLEGCCKDYVTIGSPEFKRFASEFIFFMPQFGLPRMDSGKFVQYGPSRVLPFINETKIGVQNEQGEIVSEGSNGNVYAFDIYNEYLGFSVSITCPAAPGQDLVLMAGSMPPTSRNSPEKSLKRQVTLLHSWKRTTWRLLENSRTNTS